MKIKLLLLLFLLSSFVFSQDKDSLKKISDIKPEPKPISAVSKKIDRNPEIGIYFLAIKYGDIEVAKNSIYSLLQQHPDSISYIDTLCRLYFSANAHAQTVLTAHDYLSKDPSNLFIRELLAISLGAMNKNKESLEEYENLYKQTKSLYHAYQIAVLEYVLKRYGECESSLNAVINDSTSNNSKVSINIDQTKAQQVPLRAAALNVKGVMEKDLNLMDKAKADFIDALKVYPDFVLAKSNIEALNKKDQPKPGN